MVQRREPLRPSGWPSRDEGWLHGGSPFHLRLCHNTLPGCLWHRCFWGGKLRSPLGLLRPDQARHVAKAQACQKESHDKQARVREFKAAQTVFARSFGRGHTWLPAVVMAWTGRSRVFSSVLESGLKGPLTCRIFTPVAAAIRGKTTTEEAYSCSTYIRASPRN